MPLSFVIHKTGEEDLDTLEYQSTEVGMIIGAKSQMKPTNAEIREMEKTGNEPSPKYFTPINSLTGKSFVITMNRKMFLTPTFTKQSSFLNIDDDSDDLECTFEDYPKLDAFQKKFLPNVGFPSKIKLVLAPRGSPPFLHRTEVSGVQIAVTGIYEAHGKSRFCLRLDA